MKKILVLLSILFLSIPLYAIKSVKIITRSLPNGQNGVAYSSKIAAKFGTKPYTCTKTGTMPTGLTLNSTCTITGTPTVNGTYPVLYTVTDSAGSPTVDSKTLSITIAGGAVTTTVKLETATLPNGQVGVAYSTAFTGSGGTAPYTFSKVSGNFPAGLSLVSPTLSGTPTAAGSYNFTIRVTDAGSQTYDRAFVITIASGGSYLFSENFEGNNFSAFDYVLNTTDVTTQSSIKHAGTYAAQFHYILCGDSSNPACGGYGQDINRWISKIINPGLTHFFMREYVYFKTPEVGADTHIVQRKIAWFSDDLGSGTHTGPDLVLNAWTGTGGVLTPTKLWLATGTNASSCSGSTAGVVNWDIDDLNFNTWYSIEQEIQLNTSGVSDGVWKVWVDGVQVLNKTNINLIGTCGTSISYFSWGRQMNRFGYDAVNEYRYLDDVVVDDVYIGP